MCWILISQIFEKLLMSQASILRFQNCNSFKISCFETRIMAKLRRFINGIYSNSFILIKFVQNLSFFRHFVPDQGISKSLPISMEEYQDFHFKNFEK